MSQPYHDCSTRFDWLKEGSHQSQQKMFQPITRISHGKKSFDIF
jgi:hypothetical protein